MMQQSDCWRHYCIFQVAGVLRDTIMPFTPLIAVGFDKEPLVVLRASDKGPLSSSGFVCVILEKTFKWRDKIT